MRSIIASPKIVKVWESVGQSQKKSGRRVRLVGEVIADELSCTNDK
jgi:hypothetical protein